jgi:hypothetical protein
MFGRYFWRSTGERALKTFAQALLALLSSGQLGLLDVDWAPALSAAALASLLSVLSSVASAGTGVVGSPSLLSTGSTTPSGAAQPSASGPATQPAVG